MSVMKTIQRVLFFFIIFVLITAYVVSAKTAIEWNVEGTNFENEGRYEEAIEAYNKAIEINPQDINAWNCKGNAFSNLGKYEEANEAYDEAIKINPQFVDIWFNKGNVLCNLTKYEEAIEAYDEAIKINPQDIDAWNNKGATFIDLNYYEEALECFNKVIEINPQYIGVWKSKGYIFSNLNRHEEAIECYDKAIEINPQDVDAWNNKGASLDDLNRYEDAIDAYNEVIEINPEYVRAWGNKANTLFALNRHEEAINACNKAIEIDTRYLDAWSCKGAILFDLNRYEEALECFNKVIDINPQYADAWYNAGLIFFKMGKFEETLMCINKQLEINPLDAEAWYLRETILYKVKNFPNVSVSSTCIYSLNVDGNCELYYLITYENIDYDYEWKPDIRFTIPFLITMSSISEGQPNVTEVIFNDVITTNFDVDFYPELLNNQTYKHSCFIAFSPPNNFTFDNGSSFTIKIKIEFNNASSKVVDYYKFHIFPQNIKPNPFMPIKNVESYVIRVNLPNDNYYWTEVLHTTPQYDYRIPFGRGESLEWMYYSFDYETRDTIIEYRIHPDPLRQELDKVARDSHTYSIISVILGIIALFIALKEYLIKVVWIIINYIQNVINKRNKRTKDKK